MRTLIETTFPTLAIIALPMMFYIGIIFGSDISKTSETSTSNSTETVFEFTDEPYIDDIPFNTSSIVENSDLNPISNNKFTLAEQKISNPFSMNAKPFSIGILNNFTDLGYLF